MNIIVAVKQVPMRNSGIRIDTSGKWLGADCGNVKPLGDFMQKK